MQRARLLDITSVAENTPAVDFEPIAGMSADFDTNTESDKDDMDSDDDSLVRPSQRKVVEQPATPLVKPKLNSTAADVSSKKTQQANSKVFRNTTFNLNQRPRRWIRKF